jgi:hypothetical protein
LWIVSPKARVSLINGNRFIETGAGRVDKALLAIRRIGNLAAPSYESTEAERQKIIDAIFAEANELQVLRTYEVAKAPC